MSILSGKEVLRLLESNKELQRIYDKVLPSLEKYVLKNSGSHQDAKDLFQESIILVFKKSGEKNFQLTSSIETFIFSIGKRKWLHELRQRKNSSAIMSVDSISDSNELDQLVINEERSKLYFTHFEKLSESCRKVLKLFFSGLRMSEIANEMEFKSEGYARKRKHECQGKLAASIKGDSIYKELTYGS